MGKRRAAVEKRRKIKNLKLDNGAAFIIMGLRPRMHSIFCDEEALRKHNEV